MVPSAYPFQADLAREWNGPIPRTGVVSLRSPPLKTTYRKRRAGFAYNDAWMIPECDECIAIARELRDAYSEVLKDPKAREHYSPINEMMEGMIEEDGERLERAFEKFPRWRAEEISRPELTPIGQAMHRATIHCLRTGHKLRPFLNR
jgi:hypothetical protein